MKPDSEALVVIERFLEEFDKIVLHDPEIGHHFNRLDLDQRINGVVTIARS